MLDTIRRLILSLCLVLSLASVSLAQPPEKPDPLRDALDAFADLIGAQLSAIGEKIDTLRTQQEADRAAVQALEQRVTKLEGQPTPPPDPEPTPALPQPDQLEYLGRILPPLPTAEDRAHPDANVRQFAYTEGVMCLGPKGLYLTGHTYASLKQQCYIAEISIPEPVKDGPPPRAEFLQPFTDIGANGRLAPFGRPLPRGALYKDGQLHVTFAQYYNVAHNDYPVVISGPADLARHAPDGTAPLAVYDTAGKPVDGELPSGYMAETSLGLVMCRQQGYHSAFSYGPALYLVDPPPWNGKVTGFRRLMHYPVQVFPEPTNGWSQASVIRGVAQIDGAIAFAGRIGLGTGLDQIPAGEHTTPAGNKFWINHTINAYYGSPADYPVPGVNICAGPAAKGYHAPPLEARLYLYDPKEIAGAGKPSDPRPYATINLSSVLGANNGCGQYINAIAFDAKKRRMYLVETGGLPGGEPLIRVFEVQRGT